MDYGRVTDNILAHEDAITCMCLGTVANLLASGSADCTVKIWRGLDSSGVFKTIQNLLKQMDHNSQINCLSFDK